MAAVALTKTEGKPGATIGGTKVWEDQPDWAWYTAGTIADADTTAFSNWTGQNLREVRVQPVTTGEACSAEWALSSGTLTITYRTDGSITSGALVGIRR
jgi:cytochrome c556